MTGPVRWAWAAVALLAGTSPAGAGVLLQAYYQRGDRGVPSPADPADRPAGPAFWWDHLARQAKALRAAGVTAVWLPPPLKGAAGVASVGFDPFDDYDLGSKDQRGTVPTRYGTREQLARCVAVLRANGLDVYLDLVENHRQGGAGPGGLVFRYRDAFGHPGGGRFPKDPDNFHHHGVPQDPNVAGPDFSFGADLAPVNGRPPGYVSGGLKAAANWLTRALDVQGFRFDDAKGVSTDFARDLFDHAALRGKFVVGEFFDGDVGRVRDWATGPAGMRGRASAFDFPLRLNLLAPMCNQAGFFDMARLDRGGLAGADPPRAVTFVENHDTDKRPELQVSRNKAQAYAYILTAEGYPCVFYKDYSTDPGCYGMKPVLDPLIWVHEKLAAGPTTQRFKSHDVFAFERTGGRRLLVGLNNNGAASRTVTVDTGFGQGVALHDYTGHAPDVRTDAAGRATLAIPKNENGLGYVCYSVAGVDGGFEAAEHAVTQVFEGAPDLDIRPADDAGFGPVGRVWTAAGKAVRATLRWDVTNWTDATSVTLELADPAGAIVATRTVRKATPQGDDLEVTPGATGFHSFRIRSAGTPEGNRQPSFQLTVRYTASRELPPGE